MRILVDEMANSRDDCPYCIDKSNMDMEDYKCVYRHECDCTCYDDDMQECRYFTDIKSVLYNCSDTLEDTLDGIFEKVPYDLRHSSF